MIVAVVLAIVVLLVVLWLVRRFRRLDEQPVVAVKCTPGEIRLALSDTIGLSRTEFVIAGEVIVTGPKIATNGVITDLRDAGVELGLVRDCELGDLDQFARSTDLNSVFFPFPPEAGGKLVMRLYQITTDQTVGEVVEKIESLGQESHVFADPNYLTSLLGSYQCGDPYEPVGSPYEPVGSPAGDSAEAGQGLFWGQWAFEHIGAGSTFTESWEAASLVPDGTGVRVGVFDTSPFTLTMGEEIAGDGYVIQTAGTPVDEVVQASATISWVTPTLEMTVAHPKMPFLTPITTRPITVSDHGLFVAGLIHAVAPESDIQLIRVLDKYGCGDLYTFNEALYRFIDQMDDDTAPDDAVINLSLGVRKPTSLEKDEVQETLSEQVEQKTTSLARVSEEEIERLLDDTVESLHAAVTLADSKGIVVVAAAGNDSFSSGIPVPPQIPARYPFVIGVEASNLYRERSCFSNWGDVSAPGGDTRSDDPMDPSCETKDYPPGGTRNEAVVSLSWESETNYSYWRGTSFATPLVSGLAALVLDAGVPGVGSAVPRQVFDAIRCGAPMGDGVINAPATLLRCLP